MFFIRSLYQDSLNIVLEHKFRLKRYCSTPGDILKKMK